VRHVLSVEADEVREESLDDGKYGYSWYENAQEGADADEAAVDGDASGAGLTSHF
jgi:hypothetical protein